MVGVGGCKLTQELKVEGNFPILIGDADLIIIKSTFERTDSRQDGTGAIDSP